MKRKNLVIKILVLLAGILTVTSCQMVVSKAELEEFLAKDLGISALPPEKIALLSYHDRYLSAREESGIIDQELELNEWGWFTLERLSDGKVALKTHGGQYLTAPDRGASRQDWMLRQEPELGDCGQFDLFVLGSGKVALRACSGHFLTAGDNGLGWEGELAWAVVAETSQLQDWERFTAIEDPPPPLLIADFNACQGVTNPGEAVGTAVDVNTLDTINAAYVREAERGCIAQLTYDMEHWAGFWLRLDKTDLSPTSQLVFDIRTDSLEQAPDFLKIELKRADGEEISTLRTTGLSTNWQRLRLNLENFMGPSASLSDLEELVFVFEAGDAHKTGVIYLDNIAILKAWGD